MAIKKERGEEILSILSLSAAMVPPVGELEEYIDASETSEILGPLLFPEVFGRAEKRLRAGTHFCRAAIAFRNAFEDLIQATAEESDPALDEAASGYLAEWIRSARKAQETREEDGG